jgi:L-alanine-DL-glutamate epimerase-like enolase superfamily enzyme
MLRNNAIQIVQPDLHYYGGLIRSARVAKMAAAVNVPTTAHISSGNTGFADMANFFSFTPNMGKFQEFKTGIEKTGQYFDPPVTVKDGLLSIPTAPGLGMKHIDELVKNATVIREQI